MRFVLCLRTFSRESFRRIWKGRTSFFTRGCDKHSCLYLNVNASVFNCFHCSFEFWGENIESRWYLFGGGDWGKRRKEDEISTKNKIKVPRLSQDWNCPFEEEHEKHRLIYMKKLDGIEDNGRKYAEDVSESACAVLFQERRFRCCIWGSLTFHQTSFSGRTRYEDTEHYHAS